MRVEATLTAVLVAGFLGLGAGFAVSASPSVSAHSRAGVETIYVKNLAPRYMTDGEIEKDIPAWEQAANKDFAPYWGTPQVKVVLLRLGQDAPRGSIVAYFQKNGPVQGALAYHTVINGVPAIVVYTGVGDFYGYNNSVSFTHEMFEMLADPTVSQTNQGYPYPNFCLDNGSGQTCYSQMPGTIWANEVSDAVEAFDYKIGGVQISDFITPEWFNDHEGNGRYDFMGLCNQPFEITPGGYSQFWDGSQWQVVLDFRHVTNPDAAGFLKGEKLGRDR